MSAIPANAFGVAALVVLLVPGLVFAVVRRLRKGFGPEDLSIDSRIAQALVVSVLLDAAYLALGWSWIEAVVAIEGSEVLIADPAGLGVAILVGCAAIPTALALVTNPPYRVRLRHEGDSGPEFLPWTIVRTIRSSRTPTAWDEAVARPDHKMVRVLFPDGRWVGGFYGPGSFVSTFPQPRDLFISDQYEMESDGTFGKPIAGSAGLWLRIGDGHTVEFLDPPYTAGELEELGEARQWWQRRK